MAMGVSLLFSMGRGDSWVKLSGWLLLVWTQFMASVSWGGLSPAYGASLKIEFFSGSLWVLCVFMYVLLFSGLQSLFSKESGEGYVFLMFLSMVFFMVNSSLMFYIVFELSVLPIFYIIMVTGYQPERLPAAFSLLLYTLTGSMPFLLSIVFFAKIWGVDSLSKFASGMESGVPVVAWAFMLCFLVKLPAYFVHSWLPKAHVEAPAGGSMVLAAILLKLGGYGVLIFLVLAGGGVKLLLAAWGVIGLLMPNLIALRLSDLKMIIAYSSVSHMCMALTGVSLLTKMGWEGCVLMLVSHAFSSSGLFYWAYILYTETKSRSILLSKGIFAASVGASVCWFLVLGMSMGVPPSLNFGGETFLGSSISVMMGGLGVSALLLSLVPGAGYTLLIYSLVQQSESSLASVSVSVQPSQYLTLSMHISLGASLVVLSLL